MSEHNFIVHDGTKVLINEANKLSAIIASYYLNQTYSVTRLRKAGSISYTLKDKNNKSYHGTISLDLLSSHIRNERDFNFEAFSLPPIKSSWLDSGIDLILPNQLGADSEGRGVKLALGMPFGEKFPLKPCIDREGAAYSSFQSNILKNIVRLQHRLVRESDKMLAPDGEWLSDFRFLINECVSAIDITLHQLYFMAEFKKEEFGWTFNKERLGQRHGIRLKDKLKWISEITGNPLDNASKELESFVKIKNLRNHLNHFDPPCFAYSIDNVAEWINLIPDIGLLLLKIREKLATPINREIVKIICLERVRPCPKHKEHETRPKESADCGYQSSIWTPK